METCFVKRMHITIPFHFGQYTFLVMEILLPWCWFVEKLSEFEGVGQDTDGRTNK